MEIKLPEFKSEKEMLDFIVKNEDLIIAQKKAAIKEADGIGAPVITFNRDMGDAAKEESVEENLVDKEVLNVKAVINTTGYYDSHKDVHIKGLWNKSLSETKSFMHVQEHKSGEFNKIIASGKDVKAYVEEVSWKSLGYDAEGSTEALTFESKVRKSRNPYMHEQYAKGFVENHSVGMQYVKLVTCINDEDYPVQKENYDKYIEHAVNKDAIGKLFWAVTEAKIVEGSAVPKGSNPVTPTTSTKAEEETAEDKDFKAKSEAIFDWLKKKQ